MGAKSSSGRAGKPMKVCSVELDSAAERCMLSPLSLPALVGLIWVCGGAAYPLSDSPVHHRHLLPRRCINEWLGTSWTLSLEEREASQS